MEKLKDIYTSYEEVTKDLDEYNQGKAKEERKYYIAVREGMLNTMTFVVVDYEFFRNYQNIEREERRQRDIESRCLLYSKKYGYKKCMEDCDQCPYGKYKRDGLPLSLDHIYTNSKGEEYTLEIEDKSLSTDEREELLNQLLDELEDKEEIYIMKMHRGGYGDQEIADGLGMSRRTLTDKKNRIIKKLKNKSAKSKHTPPFEH